MKQAFLCFFCCCCCCCFFFFCFLFFSLFDRAVIGTRAKKTNSLRSRGEKRTKAHRGNACNAGYNGSTPGCNICGLVQFRVLKSKMASIRHVRVIAVRFRVLSRIIFQTLPVFAGQLIFVACHSKIVTREVGMKMNSNHDSDWHI